MPNLTFNEKLNAEIAAKYCDNCVEPYENPYKRCHACEDHDKKPTKPVELSDDTFHTDNLNAALTVLGATWELGCVGESYDEVLQSTISLLKQLKDRRAVKDGLRLND